MADQENSGSKTLVIVIVAVVVLSVGYILFTKYNKTDEKAAPAPTTEVQPAK